MRILFLFPVILALLCSPAFPLVFSKSPVHYYAEMEKYYQKPRPEMLTGILQVFANGGILANSKKRMFLAAFLSELVKISHTNLDALAGSAERGPDMNATLAWIAYLSDQPQEVVSSLLGSANSVLLAQIMHSPRDLHDWNPEWEESTVDMYWGAFMATGNRYWVDRLIGAALQYASSGRSRAGRYAAATLYDYLPRHEKIEAIVREYQNRGSPAHKAMIGRLLENSEVR